MIQGNPLSRRLLPKLLIAVLGLPLALFFSCHKNLEKPQVPVFINERDFYYLEDGQKIKKAFSLDEAVRQRAMYASEDYIAAWSHETQNLNIIGRSGKVLKRWKLEGAQAWLSSDRILLMSRVFDEEKGFSFSLFSYSENTDPRLIAETELDLFVSEIVFAADGQVWLAGGDESDSFLRVYSLGITGAELKLEQPKDGDFARIVAGDDGLYFFTSAGEKTAEQKPARLWKIDNDGTLIEYNAGFPENAVVIYGYGFYYKKRLYLPWATLNGEITIVEYSDNGNSLAMVREIPRSRGLYLPIGSDPDGERFWYLAMDWAKAPGQAWLASWDGDELRFLDIP